MEIDLHSGMGSMRRFIALASLLLLSLSRVDATTQVRARATASLAHPTREMVAAAPSVRLAPITVRQPTPRGTARLLGPWHPSRGESSIALRGPIGQRVVALPQPTPLAVGPAHRLTYDATAPPRLS